MTIDRESRRGFLAKLITFLGVSFAANAAKLSPQEIVKAWEDPEFRNTLTEDQWNEVPSNPAGRMESSQFSGNVTVAQSGNGCSGNGCSGNGCSGNGCSGNNCGRTLG